MTYEVFETNKDIFNFQLVLDDKFSKPCGYYDTDEADILIIINPELVPEFHKQCYVVAATMLTIIRSSGDVPFSCN